MSSFKNNLQDAVIKNLDRVAQARKEEAKLLTRVPLYLGTSGLLLANGNFAPALQFSGLALRGTVTGLFQSTVDALTAREDKILSVIDSAGNMAAHAINRLGKILRK